MKNASIALALLLAPLLTQAATWHTTHTTVSTESGTAIQQTDPATIMVTRDQNEVVGMTKVGEVEGRSPLGGGVTSGMGDKRAIKKMRAAAAKLGATKVLIVNEEYRNMTVVYGIAYK